ncbi:hypothetical protein BMW23_0799 [Bodo saltans virus]|uniref:Uncharacterized protein n=1 Tax=Bodo saltans virus TaxID=2024608 RepID=A0A2H4UVI7_9VIRU|nr:hypothetical protein QJ851_gp0782 [Bodo saltans virus]ATZ80845.1 hypothetical protein BMW23_0799 [Bodo saltans virus]
MNLRYKIIKNIKTINIMQMNENILINKLSKINMHLKNVYNIKEIELTRKNTLFILDWDDTLFPTSWVMKNNINLINSSEREQLVDHFQSLDRTLFNFLSNIKRYGKVIIVTNAMVDWVKISSIVIPKTYNVLKTMEIISARGLFSKSVQEPMLWKKLTFQTIIDKEFKNKRIMNIISIGDAEYEHEALVSLSKSYFDQIKYLKSFRLVKDPHYDFIIDQLNVLSDCIPHLWNKQKQICKSFVKHNY